MNSADPLEAMIAEETAADHARATMRGQRVADLADSLITELIAAGIQLDRNDARVAMYHVLVDALYAGAAIDIPTLRSHD